MSTTNDGGYAFPVPQGKSIESQMGMTLREYLAAHAPPVPTPVLGRFLAFMATADPDAWGPDKMIWNMGNLTALAKQEARWRVAYADSVLSELQLKKAPQ